MSEMVEKVARAICEAIPFGVDRADAAKAARAAIEALRDLPHDVALKACLKTACETPDDMQDYWRIILDAALSPKGDGK